MFSLTAKLDVGGSAPGPAPALDLQCHDQQLNHRLPQEKVGGLSCSNQPQPPDRALSLRCMLWQQVNQHSHRRHASTQTDLRTSSYTAPIMYPARSQTSVKWLQSDRETKSKPYLCGVFFFFLLFPYITGSSDSLNAQRRPSVLVCFPFSSAGVCKDKTHI